MLNVMTWVLMGMFIVQPPATDDPLFSAVEVAEAFIKLTDAGDAEGLRKIIHPEMVQFARIGSDIHPFKAANFIQMVSDGKLGGTPRTLSYEGATLLRDGTASVRLHAVSTEYDFLYDIALAKTKTGWLVVGVLSDIKPAQ